MYQTVTAPAIESETISNLRQALDVIELDVLTSYTLADAIREGCQTTEQATGQWGANDSACAMSAGVLAAVARGYLK